MHVSKIWCDEERVKKLECKQGLGEETWEGRLVRASGSPFISQVPPFRLALQFLWSTWWRKNSPFFPCSATQLDVDLINLFLYNSSSDAPSRRWIFIACTTIKFLTFWQSFTCLNFIKISMFDLWAVLAPVVGMPKMLTIIYLIKHRGLRTLWPC